MPKITPARPDAHPTHVASLASLAELSGCGWCLPCYDAGRGQIVLAVDPAVSACLLHAQDALSGPEGGDDAARANGAAARRPGRERRSRPPRGRAARPPAGRPPHRPWTGRLAAARTRARGMVYGRRRAAVRVASGHYTPHPGWRHLIDQKYRVLVDQAEALGVVDDLVDAQEWRSDKRAAWSAILRRLVCCMDWETGLITAVTLSRLGEAGDRAPRTVSRVIAWARDAGLLVVVEHGASAEFLGTEHGRTPSYALVTTTPAPAPPVADLNPDPSDEAFAQLTTAVEENGVLPVSHVEHKPLNGRRLERPAPAAEDWPIFGVPQSAPDRTAATHRLLGRLGLDHRGVSGVPLWRARALLRPWWDAGACPAALLHAIDRHPDRPDHHRGDAFRGGRDPLRILGARLRPWRGRLHELPAELVGIPGNYTIGAVATPPTTDDSVSGDEPGTPFSPTCAEDHRAALRAGYAQERAQRRRVRHLGAAGGGRFAQPPR